MGWQLRMLRAHGIIQKVPRTHRYQVTTNGRQILTAILTAAAATTAQLDKLAA
jgi:DNA-binding HxlR family transcriptional regulator